jgi:omega-amidase
VVNIGLLQLRQYDNPGGLEYNEKTFERIRKMIHDPSYGYKIDVICLPELWYTRLVKDFEKEFRAIVNAASEYNVTIIPGAFTEKIAGNMYVSCPVIGSDRSILGRQFKINLFGTQRRYKSGSKIEIFDSGKFRFCVVICYDAVFPEIVRSAAYNGVDLLFFPS